MVPGSVFFAFGIRAAVLLLAAGCVSAGARAQQGGDFSHNPHARKLPSNTILVRGAWSSASDSTTPVPEHGQIIQDVYRNAYFRLAYPVPLGWHERYTGPPPSDSGRYVLAELESPDARPGHNGGSILITAQDLFFSLTPGHDALEQLDFMQEHLEPYYRVEQSPSLVTIAGHFFTRFDYRSPVAGLHWYIFATQIRCHLVEFIFSSRDAALLNSLLQSIRQLQLPSQASPIQGTGGGDVPVCVADYANPDNILQKSDPEFAERRFNPVPVRITIDTQGHVKFVHFLSAFPEQAKAIEDALKQWRFRPYLRNGKSVEVETGIMFGRAPRVRKSTSSQTVNE